MLLILILTLTVVRAFEELPFCIEGCTCQQMTVTCKHLKLQKLPVVPASTKYLNAEFNDIEEVNAISLRHLSLVNVLWLNNNKIMILNNFIFAGMSQLDSLYLQENSISTIKENAFKNLHQLKNLHLNSNKINQLVIGTFNDLPILEKLHLQDNYIQRISSDVFSSQLLPNLLELRLINNPLICDCNLIWIKNFCRDKNCLAYCASPPKFSQKSIEQLNFENINCQNYFDDRKNKKEEEFFKSNTNIIRSYKIIKPVSFTKLQTEVGSKIILNCSKFEATWWKNDKILNKRVNDRIKIMKNGSLLIQNIVKNDSGNFSCGKKQITYSLEILEPPIFTDVSNSLINVLSGSNLKMNCKANGFPEPEIKWAKLLNGNKTELSSSNELEIRNIKPQDQGIYECLAKNHLGLAIKNFKIMVIGGEINESFVSLNEPGFEVLKEAVLEARVIVDRSINMTINSISNKSFELLKNRHLQIARYPQDPDSIDFAKSSEIFKKSMEILKRKADAKKPLPAIKFVQEDFLTTNQLNLLSQLSGCLVSRRMVNFNITIDCKRCSHQSFRSFDGTCNNLNYPLQGSSLTPFLRILPPIYEDNMHLPVGWFEDRLYNGFPKPNPRIVSQSILSAKTTSFDGRNSHMIMQWGQFLDHDLDFSLPSLSFNTFEQEPMDCSRTCKKIYPCFSIEIPEDDLRRRNSNSRKGFDNLNCIELVRSSAVCGSGVSSFVGGALKFREQINQLTSFIDASQVYGSTSTLSENLRKKVPDFGLLRHTLINGKSYLPINDGRFPNDCQQDPRQSSFGCFLAGDVRANEQLGLLAMHTLWLREHNRIAEQLRKINPHWNGERIYQESRKIVGAQMQVITYKQWLPQILGKEGMKRLGTYKGYNDSVDATIANEFATAAMRFGHTLINPFLARLNANYQPEQSSLALRRAFFAPNVLVSDGIGPFLRGLLNSPAKAPRPDQVITEQLTEHLFEQARDVALDLAAINIQRGRDHGLPGYNEWRRWCGLPLANDFDDLIKEISNNQTRNKLNSIYGHPDNIDLWVGGVVEDTLDGAKVGATFSCLLIDQFRRLRDGDRFWYENEKVFSLRQLKEINKASLAKVICHNSEDIHTITGDVFLRPHLQQWISCDQLADIDLDQWKTDEKEVSKCL